MNAYGSTMAAPTIIGPTGPGRRGRPGPPWWSLTPGPGWGAGWSSERPAWQRSVRTRADASNAYRVVWRDGGSRTGRQQGETFSSRTEADRFRAAVELAGHRWPHGWTPGVGFGHGPAPVAVEIPPPCQQPVGTRAAARPGAHRHRPGHPQPLRRPAPHPGPGVDRSARARRDGRRAERDRCTTLGQLAHRAARQWGAQDRQQLPRPAVRGLRHRGPARPAPGQPVRRPSAPGPARQRRRRGGDPIPDRNRIRADRRLPAAAGDVRRPGQRCRRRRPVPVRQGKGCLRRDADRPDAARCRGRHWSALGGRSPPCRSAT